MKRSEDTSKFFKQYGKTSGYFKKAAEYTMKTFRKKEITKEEEEAIQNDPRYCLHWGCEKTFKLVDNQDKKLCVFHPGRWDFGPTGETMTQIMQDKSGLLWNPHWTCCRKAWKAPGCTRGKHSGPLLSQTGGPPKKYKWPDFRAQIYFQKNISEHWKDFMENHVVTTMRPVEEVHDQFAKTKGTEGVLFI